MCRRCRTDLITMKRIAEEADGLACLAIHALTEGRYSEAHDYTQRAISLRSTPFVRCLAGFISEKAGALTKKNSPNLLP